MTDQAEDEHCRHPAGAQGQGQCGPAWRENCVTGNNLTQYSIK